MSDAARAMSCGHASEIRVCLGCYQEALDAYAAEQTAALRAAGDRLVKAIDAEMDDREDDWGKELDVSLEGLRALLADAEAPGDRS